ncbi:MAG: PDR/VanB family oxidoreductase [Dehalococcoidia bacterium]
MKLIHHVTTEIRAVRRETDRVVIYELADPDDWDLPPFTPGAHLDVFLDDKTVRQYSLCGSARETKRYRIAVLAETDGRGGSLAIHGGWKKGDIVPVSIPRNNFPLDPDAPRHVFIAGGIGITPFVPMMDAVVAEGGEFRLHYATRTPRETPFRNVLETEPYRRHITFHHSRSDPATRLDIPALLQHLSADDAIYVCGPKGLIEEVLQHSRAAGFVNVRAEQFTPDERIVPRGEAAYTVELARSGRTVEVLPGQSMIEAIRAAGVEIDSSCQAGVCTSCKTRYLAGAPIHRDLVMSPEDRREFVTPCVSSVAGTHLVLDL